LKEETMRNSRLLMLVAALLLAMCAACSDDDAKEAGTEGGPCFPNGTCMEGLTCASDLCVKMAGDAAAEDSTVAGDAAPGDSTVAGDAAPEDSAASDMPAQDTAQPDLGAPDLPVPDTTCTKCSEWWQACTVSYQCAWGSVPFCSQSKTIHDNLIQCLCTTATCSADCPNYCAGSAPDDPDCNNCLTGALGVSCASETSACATDL
jgi:hypothetical protein